MSAVEAAEGCLSRGCGTASPAPSVTLFVTRRCSLTIGEIFPQNYSFSGGFTLYPDTTQIHVVLGVNKGQGRFQPPKCILRVLSLHCTLIVMVLAVRFIEG